MRALTIVLGLALGFGATTAYAAGHQLFEVRGDGDARPLNGAICYPCQAPVQEIEVRGSILYGVKDCPHSADNLPLVVMSHGRGGWFGALAASITEAGFVVAAVDHPDHNSQDRARIDALSTLVERPADGGSSSGRWGSSKPFAEGLARFDLANSPAEVITVARAGQVLEMKLPPATILT